MKREIGKGAGIAVIVVVLAVLGWFGWRSMETPENRGLNEEQIFREAEKKAKANGVDIKTLPVWGALYYKYHPEEKPTTGVAEAATPPTTTLPTGVTGQATSTDPGPPPVMR